jgi:hypothetical protein
MMCGVMLHGTWGVYSGGVVSTYKICCPVQLWAGSPLMIPWGTQHHVDTTFISKAWFAT